MIAIASVDRANFINLDCAARSVNLDKEVILSDLGKNHLKAQRINGEWRFDRQDFFVYYYNNYDVFEEPDEFEKNSELIVAKEKILTSDNILNDYAKGERDFGERILVNQPIFSDACLKGIDFYGVNLLGANFENADLEDADFRMATLYRANLKGANLKGSSFEGADLRYANLSKATLDGTSLVDAKLDGIKLKSATIQNTQFLAGIPLSK